MYPLSLSPISVPVMRTFSATPRDEFIMNLSEDIEHANALWQGWFTADEPYNTACFCTDDTCADQ